MHALAALTLSFLALAAPQELRLAESDLPAGWKLVRSVDVPAAQVRTLNERLGTQMTSIEYQFVDVRGFPLKLNLLRCAEEDHARKLEQVLSMNGREEYVERRGTTVVEFAKMNLLAAKVLRSRLGLSPAEPRVWQVSFRAGCLEQLDYMETNQVFNLFLQEQQAPGDASYGAAVRELTADWRMGDALRLRAPGPGFDVEYEFEPEPVRVETEGPYLRATFADLPRAHGIPYVDVRARVSVTDRFTAAPGEAGPNPTAPRWDPESEPVAELAARLTEDCETDRERIEALFDHVARNIRFGGDVTGSRYGVEEVLAQGYGHCWDKSDALVALARAAGLRARQVAGWVPPLGSGHVWLEVHLEGEGWLPIDATCRWFGTSEDYIPWYVSDDGELPLVYLAMPRIERVR